jgi:hypothetical protein
MQKEKDKFSNAALERVAYITKKHKHEKLLTTFLYQLLQYLDLSRILSSL